MWLGVDLPSAMSSVGPVVVPPHDCKMYILSPVAANDGADEDAAAYI